MSCGGTGYGSNIIHDGVWPGSNRLACNPMPVCVFKARFFAF
jgi:hypothetical protein